MTWYNIGDALKKGAANLGIFAVTAGLSVGIILGAGALINSKINNKTINKSGYTFISRTQGLLGHITYQRFADNSQDMEVLTSGNLLSKTYRDFNGDDIVDRITRGGRDILIRTTDYKAYKNEFDDADREIRRLALFSDYSFSK
jgi:hypothetical protein